MEILIAPLILILAMGGLALGLILRGSSLKTSCSGMECLPDDARCATCPHRKSERKAAT